MYLKVSGKSLGHADLMSTSSEWQQWCIWNNSTKMSWTVPAIFIVNAYWSTEIAATPQYIHWFREVIIIHSSLQLVPKLASFHGSWKEGWGGALKIMTYFREAGGKSAWEVLGGCSSTQKNQLWCCTAAYVHATQHKKP